MCGFPPSFSQKEKSHVHSLTRPGRGSIATSWPPVWSKVNIWREATVQAGTWGLCELLCFPLPPTLSLPIPPYPLPLYLYASLLRGGRPDFTEAQRLPALLLLDPCGWAPWDGPSPGTESQERVCFIGPVGPACCSLASLKKHWRIADRDEPVQVYLVCIYMNAKHISLIV